MMIPTFFLLLIGLTLGQTTQIRVPRDNITSLDPSSTEILSVISIRSSFSVISPDGNTLLLYNCGTDSIGVYDVSNRESPTLSSSISFASSSEYGVAAVISSDSKTGYIVHSNNGVWELMIVDLSDIQSPGTLSTYNLSTGIGPIAISPDDQTLFIWACTNQVTSTLMIIDVSNVTFPKELSLCVPQNYNNSYPFIDTVLYVSGNNLIYYGDSVFRALDISNLTCPIEWTNLTLYDPAGLAVSSDGKRVFIIQRDLNISPDFSFEIFDLSPFQKISSLILEINMGVLGLGSMAISPDNNYIFVAAYDSLIVVNASDIYNLTYQTIDTISEPKFVTLSPDGRTAFVTSDLQVTIVELYFDTKVHQKFTFSTGAVQEIVINDEWEDQLEDMILLSDGNTAFLLFSEGLEIFNLSNKTAPTFISSFSVNKNNARSIMIFQDEKTLFLACNSEFFFVNSDSQIIAVNISDLSSLSQINTFPSDGPTQLQFLTSSNRQIGFVLWSSGVQILNISDLTAPTEISMYNCSDYYQTGAFTLSEDEKTIYLVIWSDYGGYFYSLEIIDISNLSNPINISSFSLLETTYGPLIDTFFVSISPDNKAAFIYLGTNDDNLKVFDVSNPASPAEIDWSDYNINTFLQVVISSDSSTAFIATGDELLVVDIVRLETPSILRAYPVSGAVSLSLSDDESIAYLVDYDGNVIIINLQPQYALEMWTNDLRLGEVYSNRLNAFQINQNRQLSPIGQNFSFLAISLYSITSVPTPNGNTIVTTNSLLPDWITFDQNHGIVTFIPTTVAHIGIYQLCGAMSFMIPDDIFVGISNITNTTQSLDLIVLLISLGYMNPQRFLTSSYDPSVALFLPSQYSTFEPDVRSKLANYYLEMTTPFIVDSSLDLTFSSHVCVNTKSENTVNVIISLSPTNNSQVPPQFIKGNFPIIATYSNGANGQSTISMEGSLNSVNTALTQIIINLDDSITSCNGSITVSDTLNPLLTLNITNISTYFILNQAPTIGSSIQDEIDRTPIYTGQQFVIQINGSFVDPNGQDLDYSLAMQDGGQAPDWLSLRESSLVGTPPEQVTGSQLDLVIIATNQFKSSQQLVTLEIKISLLYALKLIGTYGGAFITAVGLWVYMGSIHNILCKKRYRYPKDFIIKVGDEKSVRKICCILFIAKEVKASKVVLQEIKKAVAAECNIKKPKNAHIAAHFFNSHTGKLKEEKFTIMFKQAMLKLGITDIDQHDENSSVKGYLRKEVIKQLVLHEILYYQLCTETEGYTQFVFDKIKADWPRLVDTTRDPLQFRLNKLELQKTLQAHGSRSYRPTNDTNQPFSSEDSLNNADDNSFVVNDHLIKFDEDLRENTTQEPNITPLVQTESNAKRQRINFDLLEKLFIDLAFNYHNLDFNAYDIKVIINQKPSGNRIWLAIKKVFKRDLASIEFAGKGEAAYGIRYEVKYGVLRFYGAPDGDLKDETMIVQVATKRGWILREIWLQCIPASVRVEDIQD